MSSNIVIILLLYGNIIVLTHILLTPLIEVYLATNVKKKFVTTKFWKIFKLSHPIVMAGGAETMFTQITLTFSKNNMERYYPYTWISFINQKNEKIRNWSLLMKIIYLLFLSYYFSKQLICILRTYSLNMQTNNMINLG